MKLLKLILLTLLLFSCSKIMEEEDYTYMDLDNELEQVSSINDIYFIELLNNNKKTYKNL